MSLEELPIIADKLFEAQKSTIKVQSLDISQMETYLIDNNKNLYTLIERCCELSSDPLNSKFTFRIGFLICLATK